MLFLTSIKVVANRSRTSVLVRRYYLPSKANQDTYKYAGLAPSGANLIFNSAEVASECFDRRAVLP